MLRFLAVRGAQMLASLWVATTLLFVAITLLPGDPVRALFGFRAVPEDIYAAIVADYHLDQPVWRQYLLYLGDLLQGDFGQSYPRNPFGDVTDVVHVTDVLRATVPVSFVLLGTALALQVLVGVVAGVVAARRGTTVGGALYAGSIFLVATPVVISAVVLRSVVGFHLGWLPVRGLHDGAASYVLPVLALAALSTGYVALLIRSEVREILHRTFVRAARARGLGSARVFGVHALRPSLVPVVAFLSANIGPMLVGLIIVEGVFGLPGLGGAVFAAIQDRDRGLLVGLVTFLMALVIVATAVADVVVAWLDPRLREIGGTA